jgi:hypothetical protein
MQLIALRLSLKRNLFARSFSNQLRLRQQWI